ncbi:uncharacterized protein PHALS_15143 [Plasmopara halstedii]|uniref:Uncharacterized protein n=1 Tax=Plasmopara halstedii TaxID=4781 RepID=A0A0P1B0N5_PLAHL|nr:uncharacterized protein PHALS_15143 [Plasmopara halstedii]CEG48298.1 hypothetical protein PHALS_15143 [Plasmopara halstedii]|eukprot:XP_024584667.1 hypothetical protein PHALS_15143 [Plasmopara halstedii]
MTNRKEVYMIVEVVPKGVCDSNQLKRCEQDTVEIMVSLVLEEETFMSTWSRNDSIDDGCNHRFLRKSDGQKFALKGATRIVKG